MVPIESKEKLDTPGGYWSRSVLHINGKIKLCAEENVRKP